MTGATAEGKRPRHTSHRWEPETEAHLDAELKVRIHFPPAESLQTFGSSRAATADRVSLATMLYPFIGLGSRRALFRVVYAGANAAGIGQPAIGIVIGE